MPIALNKHHFAAFAVPMVFLGSLSTLTLKYEDTYLAGRHHFHHPLCQSSLMFVGEALAIVIYSAGLETPPVSFPRKTTRFRGYLLLAPAVCDLASTVLLNLGLVYSYASHISMLSGFNVIFTGIFSAVFLGRRLQAHHWAGMLLIGAGAALIGGLASHPDAVDTTSAPAPMLGDFLAICAQLFRPIQYILEEKLLGDCDVTVSQAVGWEGMLGFLASLVLIPVFQAIKGPAGHQLDDISLFVHQLRISDLSFHALLLGFVLISTFHNWLGVTITRTASATARATLNALRTCSVWLFSLYFGWEVFSILQLAGFACIVGGTLYFNGIVALPACLIRQPRARPHSSWAHREVTALPTSPAIYGGGVRTASQERELESLLNDRASGDDDDENADFFWEDDGSEIYDGFEKIDVLKEI